MMNKQEAMKKLTDAKHIFRHCWSNDYARDGFEEGINFALETVNKLDEPEKPVVPQYVADWYEEHIGGDFEYNLYCLYIDYYEQKLDGDFKKWIGNGSKNKPIQTLVAMHQLGYEVEKEKLYEVFLKRNGAQLGVCTPDGEYKAQFTEEELKEFEFDNLDVYEVKEVEE